jgi:AP-1 complex subunit beta-1
LIGQIATLSSIYHKPPEAFVVRSYIQNRVHRHSDEEEGDDEQEYEDENDVNADGGVDLLDIGSININSGNQTALSSNIEDSFFPNLTSNDDETEAPMTKVCSADKSQGIDVFAGFRQVGGKVKMELEFFNVSSPMPVSNIAIQLNKNSFGLSPVSQQIVINPAITPGLSSRASLDLNVVPHMIAPLTQGQPASAQIQVAIKNMSTSNVFYFACNFNFEALFTSDGEMDRASFINSWKAIDDRKELYSTVGDLSRPGSDELISDVQKKFRNYNIFFIARRPVPNAEGQEVVYFSMKTASDMVFLAELTFKKGVNAAKVCLKTQNFSFGVLARVAIERLLKS